MKSFFFHKFRERNIVGGSNDRNKIMYVYLRTSCRDKSRYVLEVSIPPNVVISYNNKVKGMKEDTMRSLSFVIYLPKQNREMSHEKRERNGKKASKNILDSHYI